ncbi:MAG: DUF1015 domain-containing protein [Promethearchaeota archaeon]
MVIVSPLKPFIPVNPKEFCTKPYDVISIEEEQNLKEYSNSLIHLILPDGEGNKIYENAAKVYNEFKNKGIILQEKIPSIFVYRQESAHFNHQGLIIGISLKDYEDGNIVKHEHTREKPLRDRTHHIVATNVASGLVWTVFKTNSQINDIIEQIKKQKPKFKFEKYGYKHILWQETNPIVIKKLKKLFENEKVYIADGHHRAASAAEYRKLQLKKSNINKKTDEPWQNLLTYVASDDQVCIMPYNRVVKKLPLSESEFLEELKKTFDIELTGHSFNPAKKNEIAICLRGKWYKLIVRNKEFKTKRESLDVAILQDNVLGPILGISDPRADENLFFVGGIKDPVKMEKYITEKGNDLFINLFPVDIKDLESIADKGEVMPPKSTWFDPKLLSGLVLHDLQQI